MKERENNTSNSTCSSSSNMVTQGFDANSSPLQSGQTESSLGVAGSQPITPQDISGYADQAQFEADKRAVYKHPLFPLLALLFEKCELATQTSNETPMSDSFHHDLEAFVQHQERDRKQFLSNDPEVDGLMIKAIQVLRIHLLELDKVQELCKDFCNRYITCLKGKMQSENLLRSDYYDNGIALNNGSSTLSSHSNSPPHSYSSNGDTSISSPNGAYHNNSGALLMNHHSQAYQHHQMLGGNNSTNLSTLNQTSSSGLRSERSSIDDHHSSNSDVFHHQSSSPIPAPIIHGGTPLSQIGASPCIPPSIQDTFVQTPQSPSSGEEEEDYMGRKKPKRGVLPKHATSIMRSWLFQHIVHPYPTEDEKRQIAGQTNLTLLQVNNWFINARRRILQPMLDASNPGTSSNPKVKKMKPHSSSNKPALKYWSDNLASMSSCPGDEDDDTNDCQDESSEELEESSNDGEGNDLLVDNDNSDSSRT